MARSAICGDLSSEVLCGVNRALTDPQENRPRISIREQIWSDALCNRGTLDAVDSDHSATGIAL